jgi:hypothetical protein
VASFHEPDDGISEAWALWFLGGAALPVGRLEASLGWAERAEELAGATDSETVEVHALTLRGDALRLMGEHERAQSLYEGGLEELADQGDFWCMCLRGVELVSILIDSRDRRAIKVLESTREPEIGMAVDSVDREVRDRA